MKYASQNCYDKTIDDNCIISRMLFSELCKIMVNKITFVDFRGDDRPPWIHPCFVRNVKLEEKFFWLLVTVYWKHEVRRVLLISRKKFIFGKKKWKKRCRRVENCRGHMSAGISVDFHYKQMKTFWEQRKTPSLLNWTQCLTWQPSNSAVRDWLVTWGKVGQKNWFCAARRFIG